MGILRLSRNKVGFEASLRAPGLGLSLSFHLIRLIVWIKKQKWDVFKGFQSSLCMRFGNPPPGHSYTKMVIPIFIKHLLLYLYFLFSYDITCYAHKK